VAMLFCQPRDNQASLRSGGRGYVVKSDAAKELVVAVRAVGEKKRYTNARYVAQL
jgi:hypothetical protein